MRTYPGVPASLDTRPLLDWMTVLVEMMQWAIVEVSISHRLSERNDGIVGETETVAAVAPLAKGSEAQCQLVEMKGRNCLSRARMGRAPIARPLNPLPVVWW